ncbi:MAG: hypothetical protein ABIW80_15570 [Lapillicoccus sp.]
MIDGMTGDPGSCSQLGGSMRSAAARLVVLRDELHERSADLRRTNAAPRVVDLVEADLRLLDAVVDRLDVGGAALQRYAQELAELGEDIRRLEGAATDAGLELHGLRVVEPWGVLTTELARQRHRAQPALQQQADRLASRLGRARGLAARTMTESTGLLAAAAASARTRSPA